MCKNLLASFYRGLKDLEIDTPSIEKRFAYSFLQQLIRYVDEAHQYILEFGIVPLAHFLEQLLPKMSDVIKMTKKPFKDLYISGLVFPLISCS